MLINSFLSVLANLSLRVWVFILGLILSLIPAQFMGWFNRVDQGLFVGSSYLVEAPKGGANIGLVWVPDAELRQWQQDINSAGKLGALLSNILHSSNATVGVLLPGNIDLGNGVADGLLQRIATSSSETELKKMAEEMVERKQLLIDTLRSKRVVVGSHSGIQVGLKPLPSQRSMLDRVPEWMSNWLWPRDQFSASPLSSEPRSSLEHYPILLEEGYRRVLVGSSASQELFADFLAYYFLAATSAGGTVGEDSRRVFFWQRDRGLTLGDMALLTSPAGHYYTFNSVSDRLMPLFNSMSLEEGLARGAFPDYVLIAGKSSTYAEDYATAVYSLLNGKAAHQPWWFVFASSGLTLLITLLAYFAFARFSRGSAILTLALVLLSMLVSQMVIVAARGLWMPMAAQMVWLIVAYIFMRLWRKHHANLVHLQSRVDEAGVTLAGDWLDKGMLDDIRPVLDDCSNSSPVLQKYYDLGSAYAAKRQYRVAIETFRRLCERKRDFRDTEQKIKALESMVAATDAPHISVGAVDKTVILEQSPIDRPVLGRYEIRKELGRGAMGVVYLGYDPRIARQVAIKTLTYSQFPPHQIGDIKARFFREAEAAGRLSHPNIVSVYDVGEESDLAFIAMDYVEGKPLSAFVHEGHLLPPFEVYRIIADVASALEYAHNNHIVHRDIKPGNIMYNPAPNQVKVTDFGIARLVDDSRTSTGEILGSPLYMSPEQLKGRKVNYAADVFSLGVTFYQLLCGRLPFAGDNLASLTYEIIHGKHRGVRTVRKDLPSSASRITNQCLQKGVSDRYDSAGELAMVLKRAIKRDFAHEARKSGYV